eukprot:Skav215496  [mRNA]  locus=scaffold165:755401:767476:+ [translate_table: standard]
MGWHCHQCQIPNQPQAEYCASCGQHWGVVWQRKERRSTSKPKAKKESKKEKREKEKGENSKSTPEAQGWQVFPSSVPWVTSTPQGRLAIPKQQESLSSLPEVPPQPVLKPPPPPPVMTSKPQEALTKEEQELAKHLRGLQALGAELPPQFLEKLNMLESKEKEQDTQRPLSHGHINKLHKLQGQVQAQMGRIHKLDTEWKSFLEFVNAQMSMHVSMYKSCRADMVSTYQSKVQELNDIKTSVKAASTTLMESMPTEYPTPEPPVADQDLQHFQQTLNAAAIDVEELESDNEEMEPETQEDAKPPEERRTKSMTPFRGATSPTKGAKAEGKSTPYVDEAECFVHPTLCLAVCHQPGDDLSWTGTDAAFRFQSCQEIFQENLNRFAVEISGRAKQWTATKLRSALRTVNRKSNARVHFCEQATLHVWEQERQGQCQLQLSSAPQQLRALWHLHGQCVDSSIAHCILDRWNGPACFVWGPAISHVSSGITQCIGRRPEPSLTNQLDAACRDLVPRELPGWNQLQVTVAARPTERYHFVELWYLHSNHARVCVHSRTLILTDDMGSEDLLRSSLFVWSDMIDWQLPIRFVLVDPRPDTIMDAVAHYLLVQDPSATERGILLRSEAFPPLRRHRAVLLAEGDTVVDLFHTAQVDRTCGGNIACYIVDSGAQIMLRNNDVIPHQEGQLLQGNYRTLQEEDSDSSSDSETEQEQFIPHETASTVFPSDDEETTAQSVDDWDTFSLLHSWETQHPVDPCSSASGLDTYGIPWNELPMSYRVEDVTAWPHSVPTWLSVTQTEVSSRSAAVDSPPDSPSHSWHSSTPTWILGTASLCPDSRQQATPLSVDSEYEDDCCLMQTQRGASSAHSSGGQDLIMVSDDLPMPSPTVARLSTIVEAMPPGSQLTVATWYVRDTPSSSSCWHPQWVTLPANVLEWEEAILTPWMSEVDTTQEYQMGFLDNSEWFGGNGAETHIWVAQFSTDTHCPVHLIPTGSTPEVWTHPVLVLAPRDHSVMQVISTTVAHHLPQLGISSTDPSAPPESAGLLAMVGDLHSMQVVIHLHDSGAEEEDAACMMQRNRSRSPAPLGSSSASAAREAPAPPMAPVSIDPHDEGEGEESEGDLEEDLESWKLLYTDMPDDPISIQAGHRGPTVGQVAAAMGFPTREISAIHIVSSLHRQMLDNVALIECVADHMRPDEAAILYDVMCEAETTSTAPPQLFHAMILTRGTHTHATFLGSVRLTKFVRRHPSQVILLHNGEIWRANDPRPRVITSGDHIQISFGPPGSGTHAVDLIDWLLDEGITPWPELLEFRDGPVISPTIPFSIQSEHEGTQISAFECPEQRHGAGFAGIAFNSWFIGHARWPRCESSRVVIFTQDQNTWKSTLMRVWGDRFDPTRPYLVTWVSPRPTNLGMPEYDLLPHIIVEQQFFQNRVSALLSISSLRPDNPGITHVAVSADARMEIRGYLELAQLTDLCHGPILCTVAHDGRTLTDSEIIHRPSGCAFDITVEHEPGFAARLAGTSLLQVRTQRRSVEHPQEMEEGDTGSTPMTGLDTCPAPAPTGHTFDGPPLATMTLVESFRQQANVQLDTGSKHAMIATYFLSPDGWPTCPMARHVELGDDHEAWRARILAAWSDTIHPAEVPQLYLVHPTPYQTFANPGILAYVLVVQYRGTDQRPVLITRGEQGEYLQIAMFLPPWVDRLTVLDRLGILQQCTGPSRTMECSVRFGPRVFRDGQLQLLQPGYCIHVELVDRVGSDAAAATTTTARGLPPTPHSARQGAVNAPSSQATTLYLDRELQPTHDHVHVILIDHDTVVKGQRTHMNLVQGYRENLGRLSAVWTESTGEHFCVADRTDTPKIVFVPLHSAMNDATEVLVMHTEAELPTDREQLAFLYRNGKQRAVLHPPCIWDATGLRVCHYTQQDPVLEERVRKTREPTPWPAPQSLVVPPDSVPPVEICEGPDLQVRLPCPLSTVSALLSTEWICLTTHTRELGLEDQFTIEGPASFHWQDFDRVVILTDGSSKQEHIDQHAHMGWAFIVLGEVYGQPPTFLGWAGEPVATDKEDPCHLPSCHAHSSRAEIEALHWATAWRLSHPYVGATAFLTDSTVGQNTALGHYGTRGEIPSILLRSGVIALSKRQHGQGVLIEHTRAHAGQFWNELVDRLAGFVRDLPVPRGHVRPPHRQWQSLYPHLPLLVSPDIVQPHGSDSSFLIRKPCLPSAVDPAHVQSLAHTEEVTTTCITLKCASANVQSLFSTATGGKGKIGYLQEQLMLAGIHLVGLQETRGQEGMWDTHDWLRIAAAGHKGNHGVELWVNKRCPYANAAGRPLCFHKHHFAVVAKSTRWLLVRLDAPGIQQWIFVAHAPHGGLTSDARTSWWQEATALLEHWQTTGQCLVMIDANATTGETMPPHIRDLTDDANHSTDHFRAFLLSQSLSIPATDSRLGPFRTTWTSPDGRTCKRLDYVCLPLQHHHRCTRCLVDVDADLNFHAGDHELTGLELTWHQVQPQSPQQGNQWQYHRASIREASNLGLALGNALTVPWHTDVETHHLVVNNHVCESLQRHCPKPRGVPKKPYISDEAWTARTHLSGLRRRLRQSARNHYSEVRRLLLQRTALARGHSLCELQSLLRQECATRQAGFSDLQCNMVKALHHSTWFYMGAQADKVLTSTGSRPGDCYADWVFSVLFSRVLQRLESHLLARGLMETTPVAQRPGLDDSQQTTTTAPLMGATWMDDLAICLSAGNADDLVLKAGKILSELLTVLLFGQESLLVAKPRDFERAEASLFRLYKRILKLAPDTHITKEQLLADLGMPDLATLQRRARLRYYGLLFGCADLRLWGLFNLDVAWTEAVHWMWTRLLLKDPLPDPHKDLEPWHLLIQSRPTFWKKLVNRATRAEILHQRHAYKVWDFHTKFTDRLQEMELLYPPPSPSQTSACLFGCMSCGKALRTKAGEGVHMNKVHGLCARERYYMDSTQCLHCLKEFHTYSKLQRHLQHSHGCRRALRPLHRPEGVPPGIGSQADNLMLRQHDDLVPTQQAQGPHLPVQLREEHPAVNWHLEHDLLELLHPEAMMRTSSLPLEERIRAVIVATPLSWTSCQATLHYVLDTLDIADYHETEHAYYEAVTALGAMLEPAAWPFLEADLPVRSGRGKQALDVLTQGLREGPQGSAHFQAPHRPIGRHRVVLHLFSGRRRFGDLQWFLERLPIMEGTTLHTISLDLVFHETWGDLSKTSTQQWWLGHSKMGWIAAMMAGPPCSTWSKARGRQIQGVKYPPRILRTAAAPWGEGAFSLKELFQLNDGTVLLLFCLSAGLELWYQGGAMLLEHPAMPKDPLKASVWRLEATQLLARLPGFHLCHVWQGLFGAKSPKPTHILALNLRNLEEILAQHQITDQLPSTTSIGLDGSGGWQTTSLKEYPPALNQGLAGALAHFLQAADIGSQQQSDAFWSTVAPMQASFGQSMGKDCHV